MRILGHNHPKCAQNYIFILIITTFQLRIFSNCSLPYSYKRVEYYARRQEHRFRSEIEIIREKFLMGLVVEKSGQFLFVYGKIVIFLDQFAIFEKNNQRH